MGRVANGDRTRCFLRAKIVFNNGFSSIECIIRNMSSSGARLEVDGSLAIPQVFDLEIPSKHETHRVSAQWRDIDAIGVDFISDRDEDRSQSLLAAENRALRQAVEALTFQLREQTHAEAHSRP